MSKSWDGISEELKRHMTAAAGVKYVTGATAESYMPGITFISTDEEPFSLPLAVAEKIAYFAKESLIHLGRAKNSKDAKKILVELAYPTEEISLKEEPPKNTLPRRTRNIAKCRLCGDVIESKHVHDYVTCKCGEISVDGGHDYCKRSARDLKNVIELDDNEKPLGE